MYLWKFQNQSGHDGWDDEGHDGPLWRPAVDRANGHDVKRTTLKWELVGVCVAPSEGLVSWGGGHRRMWSWEGEMGSLWSKSK